MTPPETLQEAALRRAAERDDWSTRAEREAVAILDGVGLVQAFNRDSLIRLLAVAWLQGVNLGSHETLAEVEAAFACQRDAL